MNPQKRFGLLVLSGEMMSLVYSWYASLQADLVTFFRFWYRYVIHTSLGFLVDLAFLKLFFLRRDRALMSRFIHGWLNLILLICDGTDESSRVVRVELMSCHISSTDDVMEWVSMKWCWKSSHAVLRWSKSARFHMYILRLTCFPLFADTDDSINTPSWSDTPGMAMHLLIRLGRFVRNRSSVLSLRVGKLTACSRQQFWIVSKNRVLMYDDTWLPSTDAVYHLMSRRFRSPPIHSVAFLFYR